MLALLALDCGEVPVTIDEKTYEPKIVVDGYIFPGRPVNNIRIMRNYALTTEIRLDEILITDAKVTLSSPETGEVTLVYNPATFSYHDAGSAVTVGYGKTYRLEVEASIDGVALYAAANTSTPSAGLSIDSAISSLGPVTYREKDTDGSVRKIEIVFDRSPDTDSYAGSLVALDASLDTFIEDNAFGLEKEIVAEFEFLDELINQASWSQTRIGQGKSVITLEWWSIWFYGRYRFILYAADKNFSDYLLTHRNVMEFDGNLVEPKFHMEGDGIGVFGSAVADTVHFEILK